MTNTYLAGNLIRVTGTFADASGTPTDPSTIILEYRPGTTAAVTTVTYPTSPVIRDSAGAYHADLDTTSSTGVQTWSYLWSGTGTIQAINASEFTVEQPIV